MLDLTLRGGIGARVDSELEVKRSRFITRLERVGSEAEARAVIDTVRRGHWDARHNCSAFVIGAASEPGQIRRSNDDGEPSGTAGMPMLEALTGRGLIDVVAVVTRYFGGILLGAGGLVRAYSDAVLGAIDAADADGAVVGRAPRDLFTLALPHADAGRIEAELRRRGIVVLGVQYEREAVLTLAGAPDDAAIVASATAGRGRLVPVGTEWIDVERD
ncbi:YigZ family protein [Diaminobutyricimonas sp. LJ205]|uniref:IMPACT family protein n=1 Tax=Diaminobutyricimonas sp. LJ205 TaxID=2683590 RepID=UPI0012F50DA2|nr:YigZ family protein [Diaminobutyricimonas sp. LJ205]